MKLKVVVEAHRHDGTYISRGKEDSLCTKNLVPGESVYGEKRIAVEVSWKAFGLNASVLALWAKYSELPTVLFSCVLCT